MTDVDRILGALAGWDPSAVRSLSTTLALSEPPLRAFAQPFDYAADAIEDPRLSGDLARLSTRRALRLVARDPRCGELLERLEGVDEPPWPQVREALAGASGGC